MTADISVPTKILVIRFSSLGDVVLTTVIFPNVKAKWPHAHVTMVTKRAFAPVFDGNPDVDRVIGFDPGRESFGALISGLRKEAFDVVIDLHGNLRSWTVRLLTNGAKTVVVDKAGWARRALVWFKRRSATLDRSVRERHLDVLKALDVSLVSVDTRLYPRDVRAASAAAGLGAGERRIGVAPGARHATKRWPAAHFADAANRLAGESGATVVLVGDKSDEAASREAASALQVPFHDLTGRTSLGELVAIVSTFDLLITNDSGILHVGEALGIPTVALFGPTVRDFGFAPYRPSSRAVEKDLPCRPCSIHGDARCPLGHHRCMRDLDVDAVVGAAREIAAPPTRPPETL